MAPRRTTKRTTKARRTHVRRRNIFRRKPRTFKKQQVRANHDVITYMVPRNMPFPPRYRTKMSFGLFGSIFAGGLDTIGRGQVYVGLNYLYHPINNATWNLTGPVTVNSGIPPNVLQPTGYDQIAPTTGFMYRKWRVYASKISMSLTPETPTDYMEVSITPSQITSSPIDVGAAMAQPYTRSKFFATGKAIGNPSDILSSYMTVHKIAGVTSSAIQNDLSGQFIGNSSGGLPTTQYYWVVNFAKVNYTDNTLSIDLNMKVTYWVEFFDLSAANLPDT